MADAEPGPGGVRPDVRGALRHWQVAGLTGLALVGVFWYLHGPTVRMELSSGHPGSVYHQVAEELVEILDDAFPGFPDRARVTFHNLDSRGSVENVRRIMLGEAQLALAEEGIELENVSPRGASDKAPAQAGRPEVRALVVLFSVPLKVVVRRDLGGRGAGAMEDLTALKRVAEERRAGGAPVKVYIGAEGSGTRTVSRWVLDHYGFITNLETGQAGSFEFQVEGNDWDFDRARKGLEDNEIQVAFLMSQFSSDTVKSIARTGKFLLLSIDRAEGIHRSHPFLDMVRVPPGSYPAAVPFPDKEIQTLSADVVLVGSSELSDLEAYRIVQTLFLHSHELGSAFPFMAPLSKADQLRQRFYYPPHPGALAFYEGKREPHLLLDALTRYRDVLIGIFSIGGTAWAVFHFFVGRWRSRPILDRLHRDPSTKNLLELEREVTKLFATGKLDKDRYQSVKEYIKVHLDQADRAERAPKAGSDQNG
ncbi:MAG: TAXI family TRAP transporter solute-binding subunit [Nitrospirota bacterium]